MGKDSLGKQRVNSSYQLRLVAYPLSVHTLKDFYPGVAAVHCGFDLRSIRGAGSQRSKFGDRRQSFDLESPSVRLRASSGLPREMTVRLKACGVLAVEPNGPFGATHVSSAENSVLR